MARVYSKDSVQVLIRDHHREDVADVAEALVKEIEAQDVKLSIDTIALFYNLMIECGYEPEEVEK